MVEMKNYKIELKHLTNGIKKGKSLIGICPYHDDTNPSLVVFPHTVTGDDMFKCFSCGKSGNAQQYLTDQGFIDAKQDSPPPKPKKAPPRPPESPEPPEKRGPGRPKATPTPDIAEKHHQSLLNAPNALKKLEELRGWNLDTIKKYQIGLFKQMITLPVYVDGHIANIRVYNAFKIGDGPKFRSWAAGLGSRADLYPDAGDADLKTLLCEGEPDALLARQKGFNAVAFTAGVSNIKDDHLNLLAGRDVNICFDIDKPGQQAALKIARYIEKHCPTVKIINLPIEEPANGDITDYFMGDGVEGCDLAFIIDATPPYSTAAILKNPIEALEPVDVQLEAAALAENSKIKQTTLAMVAGKDTEPFLIPKIVRVECIGSGAAKQCAHCPLDPGSPEIIEFSPYDPELLKIIGNTENVARGVYRQRLDIPAGCKQWTGNVHEAQNVEELILMPEINDDAEVGRPYIIRKAYIFNKILDTNQPYKFTGYTAADPYTHHVKHVYESAEPTARALDKFDVTPEIIKELQIFQTQNGEHPHDKINHIASDLETHVTKIVGRSEIIHAMFASLFSILKFKFAGKDIRRGWVEVLIVGDPRTAKSETGATLLHHLQAGEMVGAENTSFAGLVGGINQVGNRRYIQWGKLPLNDGRAIILDEFSGMDPEDIGKLSGIRASGIAEITKIQTQRTHARVRLVILSNPRTNDLSHYNMGIEAVRHLIGKPEDIARFDYALTVKSDEVPTSEINRTQAAPSGPPIYTSDLCHDLIRWAWTRRPEHVTFTDKATEIILWFASVQAKTYHSSIPLVEPAEQRIKLARISASIAAQVFSTPDGHKLIVTEKHAETAYNIMEAAFKKPSMKYDQYSASRKYGETIRNEGVVKRRLLQIGSHGIHGLLSKGQFNNGDFEDLTGLGKNDARDFSTYMIKSGCLRKPGAYFVKTPLFTNLLTSLQAEILLTDDDGLRLFELASQQERGEDGN